jgi:beta-glucosidase
MLASSTLRRPARFSMLVLTAGITCFSFQLTVSAQTVPAAESKPATVATAGRLHTDKPWMNKALFPRERANLLIKSMTLDEKIHMMHGIGPCPEVWSEKCPMPIKGYVGEVPAIERLGIPHLNLADGRAGVGNKAVDVTLLPAPIAAASSWDVALLNQFGRVLGKEQWDKGTNVTLSPTIDVVRVPEWGRTFESYGEDPYLNARMAVAEIGGIQAEGSIADANMYLTMQQESDRFKADSVVDERTLQEIYLPPYAAAVEEGRVGTFMCAYVKTNGVYSCENAHLLQEILRKQLKFDGWVMSDWGATHSTVDAANNGLDQEMPVDEFLGAPLKKAVEDGKVTVATIDDHVRNILVPMFRQGLFNRQQPGNWDSKVRTEAHAAFSRKVAEQGTILLKNHGAILPLAANVSVAVIGEAGSTKPKAEGGGSSEVVAPYVVSPFDGISKRGKGKVTSEDGTVLDKAAAAARAADVAIVFVRTEETEGGDRPDLKLPNNQDALISAVAAANPKTIVVLDTGGPVLMPWIDHVAGVVEAWYSGQEDGNAIAAILYGDVNPGAKLPLTIPRTASEIPTVTKEQWPGVGGKSYYSEKLNVGYRWYDATDTAPLFPFGFGLSYTTFKLSNLAISPATFSAGAGPVKVTVDVTNTGRRAGAEVVQVYVGHPAANGEPPHQLRAFAKVDLKLGETKPVTLTLDRRSFSIFDVNANRWTVKPGVYEIFAGSSSRDLPLKSQITVGTATIK